MQQAIWVQNPNNGAHTDFLIFGLLNVVNTF